ncbi:cytochrome C oxidase subunit IV family protein [Planctomycetota bacterium]|nr:cytochrome C oxidase subunit IV family protein [Planctomycetota bacterium]
MSDTHEHGEHDDHHEGLEGGIGHVSSVATLLKVIGSLLVLTVVTVLAAQIHLGEFNVVGALAIASVKAGIVMLFFMHLRYDNRFNFLVMAGSLAMAVWFIGYTLMDTKLYQGDINDYLHDEASKVQVDDPKEAAKERAKFTDQAR